MVRIVRAVVVVVHVDGLVDLGDVPRHGRRVTAALLRVSRVRPRGRDGVGQRGVLVQLEVIVECAGVVHRHLAVLAVRGGRHRHLGLIQGAGSPADSRHVLEGHVHRPCVGVLHQDRTLHGELGNARILLGHEDLEHGRRLTVHNTAHRIKVLLDVPVERLRVGGLGVLLDEEAHREAELHCGIVLIQGLLVTHHGGPVGERFALTGRGGLFNQVGERERPIARVRELSYALWELGAELHLVSALLERRDRGDEVVGSGGEVVIDEHGSVDRADDPVIRSHLGRALDRLLVILRAPHEDRGVHHQAGLLAHRVLHLTEIALVGELPGDAVRLDRDHAAIGPRDVAGEVPRVLTQEVGEHARDGLAAHRVGELDGSGQHVVRVRRSVRGDHHGVFECVRAALVVDLLCRRCRLVDRPLVDGIHGALGILPDEGDADGHGDLVLIENLATATDHLHDIRVGLARSGLAALPREGVGGGVDAVRVRDRVIAVVGGVFAIAVGDDPGGIELDLVIRDGDRLVRGGGLGNRYQRLTLSRPRGPRKGRGVPRHRCHVLTRRLGEDAVVVALVVDRDHARTLGGGLWHRGRRVEHVTCDARIHIRDPGQLHRNIVRVGNRDLTPGPDLRDHGVTLGDIHRVLHRDRSVLTHGEVRLLRGLLDRPVIGLVVRGGAVLDDLEVLVGPRVRERTGDRVPVLGVHHGERCRARGEVILRGGVGAGDVCQ